MKKRERERKKSQEARSSLSPREYIDDGGLQTRSLQFTGIDGVFFACFARQTVCVFSFLYFLSRKEKEKKKKKTEKRSKLSGRAAVISRVRRSTIDRNVRAVHVHRYVCIQCNEAESGSNGRWKRVVQRPPSSTTEYKDDYDFLDNEKGSRRFESERERERD